MVIRPGCEKEKKVGGLEKKKTVLKKEQLRKKNILSSYGKQGITMCSPKIISNKSKMQG